MSLSRILVVSLGNPAPYANTLHSAGHLALAALQRQFPSEHPPFVREKYGKSRVAISDGKSFILLQSPTLMNDSGRWVHRAWNQASATHDPTRLGLVIVHDDLEEDLGVVKIRDWNRSGRGHNGIKSIKAHMPAFQGHNWARISVGIGRPNQRDQSSVTQYVLGKMPSHAQETLENSASAITLALKDLERKWAAALLRAEAQAQEGSKDEANNSIQSNASTP